jgi:hypothetical protein
MRKYLLVAYTFKCLSMKYVFYIYCFVVGIDHGLNQYGTMQFGKFEEIQKKGYLAAMDMLDKWDEEGKLPSAYIAGKDVPLKGRRKGQSARRNSI